MRSDRCPGLLGCSPDHANSRKDQGRGLARRARALLARASPRVRLSPKNVVTLYRRCRPVPPQVGHCLWAHVDIAPKRRPVPLQVRHLRNGVSQIDTSHMTKPTTAVITAPVPASCVCATLPKNTAANIKTHPMSVMIPCAAEECNRQSGASLASPGTQAD
jgi:hypothetical protein